MEDNMSWPPRSNDRFGVWNNLLNPLQVTEALNRPQKRPNMVLNDKFSQPYSQYSLRAWASDGVVYPMFVYPSLTWCSINLDVKMFHYLRKSPTGTLCTVSAVHCALYYDCASMLHSLMTRHCVVCQARCAPESETVPLFAQLATLPSHNLLVFTTDWFKSPSPSTALWHPRLELDPFWSQNTGRTLYIILCMDNTSLTTTLSVRYTAIR